MTPRLLLIVGLQKSGTSLLARLLHRYGALPEVISGEGHELWGNLPVFCPAEYPTGTLYQRRGGVDGHALTESDADDHIRRTLQDRVCEAAKQHKLVLNKSPYHSVRLSWLRAVFPDCMIVAMVRRPEANVFSLLKKHHPHAGRGQPPHEGWWGVQPAGWRGMVQADKLIQSAHQWSAVNLCLAENARHVDLFLCYHQLCTQPTATIQRVLALAMNRDVSIAAIEPLNCLDDEFRRGARLLSKNRDYRRRGDFTLPDDEAIELPPLTSEEAKSVGEICAPVAARFPDLCLRAAHSEPIASARLVNANAVAEQRDTACSLS
jgi:hypothetical protein